MPPLTQIVALKVADPERWLATVRAALTQHKGDLDATAKALGVSRRTMNRWVACDRRAKANAGRTTQRSRCGRCEGCRVVDQIELASGGARWDRWQTDFHEGLPSVAAVVQHAARHPDGSWQVERLQDGQWQPLEARLAGRRKVSLLVGEVPVAIEAIGQIRCRPLSQQGEPVRWNPQGDKPPGRPKTVWLDPRTLAELSSVAESVESADSIPEKKPG